MKRLVLRIYDYLSSHKGTAAAVLLCAMLLCVWSLLRLDFEEDISAFLPQSGETRRLSEVYEHLSQDRIAVFFDGEDREDAMYAFLDLIPEGLYASQEDSGYADASAFIMSHWPYFMKPEDYSRADSLLSEEGFIASKFAADREILSGVGSSAVSAYLRSDPLGVFTPALERLRQLNPAGDVNPEDEGILLLTSPYGSSESGNNAALMALLEDAKEQVRAMYPAVTITSTGAAEVAVGNASRIKKDSFLALAIAAILIAIVLWLSYKRFADVLWILITILCGALFALGLIAAFKSTVSIIILGIGSMIIGIAVNYPLHYVDHLKYQGDKRTALAQQVNPLLVGNITTVGAFLGLLLMRAPALRDFGFIGAAMLLGTIIFTLIFLPVFVPKAKQPRNTIKLDLDRNIHLSPLERKCIFAAFCTVTMLFTFLEDRVGFDADLHNINYMSAEQEEGFARLAALGSASDNELCIVAEAPSANEALELGESAIPEGYAWIGDFIPPSSVQQERLRAWNEFLQRHPSLWDDCRDAAVAAGFTEKAFEPFHGVVSTEAVVLDYEDFAPLSQSLGKNLIFDDGYRVLVAAALPRSNSFAHVLQQDFNRIGLVCSFIVFFFLWLSFGRLELALVSFLPLAAGWVWILGGMGLLGWQFNIVNIVLASFIFGQGDDYSIFITEGLMYERATGKKILPSFKNAVALSAILMFAGIGALVVAKHPAMRSLGSLTMLGMFIVVVMAFYLPPVLFRFITTQKGKERALPLTFANVISTAYISVVFVVAMVLLSCWAFVYFHIGRNTERKRRHFHRLIQWVAKSALRLIPGGKYTVSNPLGETFSKSAVYICNHQSHLDVLAVLSLTPKVIFMTNEWAWNFPLYGYVIRKAEFLPASYGYEKGSEQLKDLVRRGYSIAIFPEGTRSMDCSIGRFHRGAFLAARELDLEILPLYIHGFGYTLPKHDFLLRRAPLYMEVGERFRIGADEDIREVTRNMRHIYEDVYARIRAERESASYCAPFVRNQYLYKGADARAECRKYLRKSVYQQLDAIPDGGEIRIEEAGCGVYALLLALSHPNTRVTACEKDEDRFLTATRCSLPENLTYER